MGVMYGDVQAREAVIPVVFGRRFELSLPRVAGHYPGEIWHVELPEGGTVKPPYCSCCVQIVLNT